MHVRSDNPREANPSGPTIHAKPSRHARQFMRSQHVMPDNPRHARQSTSGPTDHAKPTRQARQSTSCQTVNVRPDSQRQARQSTSCPTRPVGPFGSAPFFDGLQSLVFFFGNLEQKMARKARRAPSTRNAMSSPSSPSSPSDNVMPCGDVGPFGCAPFFDG
jgi:hypothetical protein